MPDLEIERRGENTLVSVASFEAVFCAPVSSEDFNGVMFYSVIFAVQLLVVH